MVMWSVREVVLVVVPVWEVVVENLEAAAVGVEVVVEVDMQQVEVVSTQEDMGAGEVKEVDMVVVLAEEHMVVVVVEVEEEAEAEAVVEEVAQVVVDLVVEQGMEEAVVAARVVPVGLVEAVEKVAAEVVVMQEEEQEEVDMAVVQGPEVVKEDHMVELTVAVEEVDLVEAVGTPVEDMLVAMAKVVVAEKVEGMVAMPLEDIIYSIQIISISYLRGSKKKLKNNCVFLNM